MSVLLRSGQKSQITRVDNAVNNHESGADPLDLGGAETLLTRLVTIQSKLILINEDLYKNCKTDADVEAVADEDHALEMRISGLKVKINAIIKLLNPSNISTPSSTSIIKLPRMDLVKFDGKFENWKSFEDMFIASIENNSSLTGAQKLHYLKCSATGEAANLIKSFTVTDSNYKEAWGLLKDRYDNTREIVNSIISRMWNQPSSKSESSQHLRRLLDVTSECIRSLKVMGRPVEHWDDLIVFLIQEKMDPESRREWVMSLKGTDPPTVKELQQFFDTHIRGLQAQGQKSTQPNHTQSSSSNQHGQQSSSSTQQAAGDLTCKVCEKSHIIHQCPEFQALSPDERSKLVRAKSLCSNCLRSGHVAKNCTSKYSCKKCGKRHHTILHFESKHQSSTKSETTGANFSNTSSSHSMTQTLLKTALVKLQGKDGQHHICRAFLDDGSESNFISEDCVKRLGLKKEKVSVSITGLASSSLGSSSAKVNTKLTSLIQETSLDLDALVVNKVTTPLPKLQLSQKSWSHTINLPLADPNFHEPSKIDLLLGGEVVASLLCPGIKNGHANEPIAQNTLLGWVLMGKTAVLSQPSVQVHYADVELDKILERFWKVEELPTTTHLTKQEKECEGHFATTHSRDESGRYIVSLPFTKEITNLGTSRDQAMRRFLSLERRFQKLPSQAKEYKAFMKEYIDLGHMELVPENEIDHFPHFYLPHHFVLKQSSTTTKLRVVFDGSAKSSTGVSLNQVLMIGPKIQDDLINLLIRFRTKQVALKADVTKMYRQFKLSKKDTDFHRILWRESSSIPLRVYRLTRVTYGTASGAYQATKCQQQLAHDHANEFPLASQALLNDFYVDDFIGGANTPEEAIKLQNELIKLMACGGMEIRKWMSSDPSVLQSIAPELRDNNECLEFDDSLSVPALGVMWIPSSDIFKFSVSQSNEKGVLTKRKLLSELAKVFDPLGLLAPTTITSKIIFQDLWKEKLGWDEPLNNSIQHLWSTHQLQLKKIEKLSVPRCIIISKVISYELIAFSDASQKSYATVVYLKSKSEDGSTLIRLIASKTRVAPVQVVSIPRLELRGAVLLTELVTCIKNSFKFDLKCEMSSDLSVTAFTDSTVVLDWLDSFPGRWKTFVANRVATIQDSIPANQWRHVRGEDNPADLPSRGILAEELVNSDLWWNGPSWLKLSSEPPYPRPRPHSPKEEKTTVNVSHIQVDYSLIINRFSSFSKMLRVTSYLLRFIRNSKPKAEKKFGPLIPEEIHSSLLALIKSVQRDVFAVEIKNIMKKTMSRKSKIAQLNPFLDNQGLLRVGGRLTNSQICEDKKNPIILPHNSPLTLFIIRQCHLDNLHGGFQLVHSTLARNYWIIRARDTIRLQIRKCVTCRKSKAVLAQQLMGSLPVSRVSPTPPFQTCCVDFAGPYNLLNSTGRGSKTFKAYFAVFVCFSTKALHLEPVTDLSSAGFLACFKRFAARRGVPADVYSDNGTNFVGAEAEMKEVLESDTYQNSVSHGAADLGTRWHFNPPAAPHQGGLWEAGVKSVKYHLRRVYGVSHLTLD